LQRFCTHWMLLPSSHELLSGVLTVDEHPFTSGGFSDVYKGIYQNSQVCVKRLTHQNIVPFIGATVNPLRIASEWMPGGDLTTYINTKPRTNQVALLVDTAGGLEYLHSLGVIHGDLKGVSAHDHAPDRLI
ncbi:kinase-like domain-containing protein, partial [Thelephora terrestris]